RVSRPPGSPALPRLHAFPFPVSSNVSPLEADYGEIGLNQSMGTPHRLTTDFVGPLGMAPAGVVASVPDPMRCRTGRVGSGVPRRHDVRPTSDGECEDPAESSTSFRLESR